MQMMSGAGPELPGLPLHDHCISCIKSKCTKEPSDSSCHQMVCELGCGFRFHACKLPEHIQLCENQRVQCINASSGCPVVMPRHELNEHLERCPASVMHCTMEWNRWPVYSSERQSRVPFVQENIHARYGQLDVALALRDQRVLNQAFKAPRSTRRVLRNNLTQRFPAVPFCQQGTHAGLEEVKATSEASQPTVSDDDSDAPWQTSKQPPGLQSSVCQELFKVSASNWKLEEEKAKKKKQLAEEDTGADAQHSMSALREEISSGHSSSHPSPPASGAATSEGDLQLDGLKSIHISHDATANKNDDFSVCDTSSATCDVDKSMCDSSVNDLIGDIPDVAAADDSTNDRQATATHSPMGCQPIELTEPNTDGTNLSPLDASSNHNSERQSGSNAGKDGILPKSNGLVYLSWAGDSPYEDTSFNYGRAREKQRKHFQLFSNPNQSTPDSLIVESDPRAEEDSTDLSLSVDTLHHQDGHGDMEFGQQRFHIQQEVGDESHINLKIQISDEHDTGAPCVDATSNPARQPPEAVPTPPSVEEPSKTQVSQNIPTAPTPDLSLKLQEILALDLNIETITRYQIKPKSMYTFLCAQNFRRDEFKWHIKNVHNDIHAGLNGWMEYRCPLASYGCTYSLRRFSPHRRGDEVIYNTTLESFGVKPKVTVQDSAASCKEKVPCSNEVSKRGRDGSKESTPEIFTSKDYDADVKVHRNINHVKEAGCDNSLMSCSRDETEANVKADIENQNVPLDNASYTGNTTWKNLNVYHNDVLLNGHGTGPRSNNVRLIGEDCNKSLQLELLPFEILQFICGFLDGFALCNLSLTSHYLRQVCCSLLDEKGIVVPIWERRIREGKTCWDIAYKKWSFSTAFSPVTQWAFNDHPHMAMHLQRCPFYMRDPNLQPSAMFSGMVCNRGPEFNEIMQRMYPDFEIKDSVDDTTTEDHKDSEC